MRFLFRRVLLPLYERAWQGRKTFSYLAELEKSQWHKRDVLDTLQFERLQALLRHAYAHIPYYRTIMDELALRPDAIQSLGDFARLPLLRKETIRTRSNEFLSSHSSASKDIDKATGGSSGEPLQFRISTESYQRRAAATYRGYGWAGAAIGTKQLHLWGVPMRTASRLADTKDYIYNALHRRTMLNSFSLSNKNIESFLEVFQRIRPEVVVAFTNPLFEFARELEERGLRPPVPNSIVVGAEKLHDFQRTLIERVFQAPVFETYGCREFMLMASQCEHRAGLHVTHENLLIEILDEDGKPSTPGHEGDVVVTDLTNFAMPFIRYAVGDRAVSGTSTCACGRGLPLIDRIVGRQLDVIRTPDGRLIPGEFFPHLVKEFPAVRRFQVVQDREGAMEMRVVLTGDASEQLESLTRLLQEQAGPTMQCSVRRVDEIPLTKHGKQQVVLNNVYRRADTNRAT